MAGCKPAPQGDSAPEIEITPAMIAAGARALMDLDLSWVSYEEIAKEVLLAGGSICPPQHRVAKKKKTVKKAKKKPGERRTSK